MKKAKYRPAGDPDYPEYANISAFIDDVLKAAGVTEVYDCDGYTAAELLVKSIQRQLEKVPQPSAEGAYTCILCGEMHHPRAGCPQTSTFRAASETFAESRRRTVSEWQPIETAPKFEWVLLWWPDVTNAPFVGYQVHGVWRTAMRGDSWSDLPGPTHWMPLPKPPASNPESR